jgi:hypothetical protein
MSVIFAVFKTRYTVIRMTLSFVINKKFRNKTHDERLKMLKIANQQRLESSKTAEQLKPATARILTASNVNLE